MQTRTRTVARAPLFLAVLALVASACTSSGVDTITPPSSGAPATSEPAPANRDAFVRVDQVGYPAGEPFMAFLLSRKDATGSTYTLVRDGEAVSSGPIGKDMGSWSDTFAHVYAIGATAGDPGTYTIDVTGTVAATSPTFAVDTLQNLFAPMLANARTFYEAQRDGPDVIRSVLDRRPSHLHDRNAPVYEPLKFTPDYVPKTPVPAAGAPHVDVSGGWFDAGDYIKGVQTASYAASMLLVGVRDFPDLLGAGAPADFTDELRFELDWLLRMWDDRTGTLYYQVGIGDGSDAFAGDHDLWRLPQVDDNYRPHDPDFRFVRHRPAFRAGPPGSPVSPNLAGRLAAAFGLCAQVYQSSDPAFAARCLASGEHVYALADTTPKRLVTFAPWAFYPETEWHSDLELGAIELTRAVAGLPAGSTEHTVHFYVTEAARWAFADIHGPQADQDTLNLYDVSGLAHAELLEWLGGGDAPAGLPVDRASLLADMRRQLMGAVAVAGDDPFGFGFPYDEYDGTSHAQGLAITASLFDRLAGTDEFAAFAAHQLDVILGENAWGASFIVGAGHSFPVCLHHQIANITGALDGTAPLLLGAAVNGTNGADQFSYLGLPDGARTCPPAPGDTFGRFDGMGARYWDNARSWPTVEPAIDFVASTPLAFALRMTTPA